MLKTNSKIVRERVQQYLLECARVGLADRQTDTAFDKVQYPMMAVNAIWHSEKSWEFEKKYRHFDIWCDWQTGLCSALPAYKASIYNLREKLQEWLEQSDAQSSKYDDSQVEHEFFWLTYREFIKLLEKEQHKFNKENDNAK